MMLLPVSQGAPTGKVILERVARKESRSGGTPENGKLFWLQYISL